MHFTVVADRSEGEIVHFCKMCAPPTGFENLSWQQLEALSVVGKKCEFCGKDAISGQMFGSGGAIYWCLDCGLEFGRIVMELVTSERPELMQRISEEDSFVSLLSDPELRAWSGAANQRAVGIMKDWRRQDGRNSGS